MHIGETLQYRPLKWTNAASASKEPLSISEQCSIALSIKALELNTKDTLLPVTVLHRSTLITSLDASLFWISCQLLVMPQFHEELAREYKQTGI